MDCWSDGIAISSLLVFDGGFFLLRHVDFPHGLRLDFDFSASFAGFIVVSSSTTDAAALFGGFFVDICGIVFPPLNFDFEMIL